MRLIAENENLLIEPLKEGVLDTASGCAWIVVHNGYYGSYPAGTVIIVSPDSVVGVCSRGKNVYFIDAKLILGSEQDDESAPNDLSGAQAPGDSRTDVSDLGTTGDPGN